MNPPRPSNCRQCGKRIYWAKYGSKKIPVNAAPKPEGTIQLSLVDGEIRAEVINWILRAERKAGDPPLRTRHHCNVMLSVSGPRYGSKNPGFLRTIHEIGKRPSSYRIKQRRK